MKRFLALLLILMLILSLAACGKKPIDTTSTTTTTAAATTTTVSTTASADGSTASSTAPSAGVTSSTAASDTDSTTTAMPVATQTAVGKTTTAAQTAGTTASVTNIEGTVWKLTYLDNYNVLHRYTLNFKTKKLQYDSGVIWSEAFTPENWAHQKIKHPHSAATFDGKEYYMDVTVTYDITCKIAANEASLSYRLGNGITISQKFALESDNTLRVVSDDNPYGSIAEHRYRP